MSDVVRRLRDALRPAQRMGRHAGRHGDAWIGDAPTREEIEERLGGDEEARALLFDWSMAEFVERYLRGRAVAGGVSRAGRDRHEREPVRQGHGVDSLSSCVGAAGWDAGHVGLRAGRHGDGVVLLLRCGARGGSDGGCRACLWRRFCRAKVWCWKVASGSLRALWFRMPIRGVTLRLLGRRGGRRMACKGGGVRIEGCTVKLNVHLRELPNFTARPGTNEPHHYGQINAPLTKDEWKAGFAAARRGELPEHLWCELYFQSVHDASVAPAGTHTMSVFAQYVPYTFARGTWDERREEVRRLALSSLARFCSNIGSARCGGASMRRCWAAGHREEGGADGRTHLSGRMPAGVHVGRIGFLRAHRCEGLYLCGACTHPGGSVIGINGRNAAMAVLKDLGGGPTDL